MKIKKLTERDLVKLEIAEHLGLGNKLAADGWGGLSACETGRIGAKLKKLMKRME